jgi:hypothetical protein
MNLHSLSRRRALDFTIHLPRLLPLCVLLIAGGARAQMIPLEDLRRDGVDAFYYDVEVYQDHHPPVPFGYWEDFCVANPVEYEPCDPPQDPPNQCIKGQTFGNAYQIGQFFPAAIQFSGTVSGSWDGVPAGLYSTSSYCAFKFRLDNPVDYDFFVDMDPGDAPLGGAVRLYAYTSGGTTMLYEFSSSVRDAGRLGPGTYRLEGLSNLVGTDQYSNGITYSVQWTVHPPPQPHIAFQPSDHSAGCGGTVVFSVGTTLAASNYTFQWRSNFVPLTNGPGVSGATTSSLTLTNVCAAGDYDVVVTGPNPLGGGTVSEPSRLAHLSITTPTGVEVDPTVSTAPAIRAAAPNPFRSSTSVDYVVHQPTRLVANVYNASGARVRSLADRMVTGPGSVSWDGRLSSGNRAPTGIYFLRFELGGLRETRKAVLLQ